MAFWKHLADAAYTFTLLPYITWHKRVTHKYGELVEEKFGNVKKREGDKKCLLIHAVSVGEAIAAQTLIDQFTERHPEWDIFISVSTATGREVAAKRYGAERVGFYPLDISRWINRFFDNVKPDAIILMELEVWPNFLTIANERGIPVIVANGRITEKSAAQYKKMNWFPPVKQMLNKPELWLAQNEEYAARMQEIGIDAEKIHIGGNVKFDTVPTEICSATREQYRRIFGISGKTPVIVAGSTHPTEDEVILEAWEQYRKSAKGDPYCKLILVPRHPHRLDDVEALAQKHSTVVRRSKISEESPAGALIILGDTMGELGKIYSAADLVFIGGTLNGHGGQNMLESCGLQIPTIIGPSYHNFNDPVKVLREADGICIIDNPQKLAPAAITLLTDSHKAETLAANGREALLSIKGATAKTLDNLDKVLLNHGKLA